MIQSKVSDLNKKEHQTSTFDDSDTCDSEVDRQVEMFMKRFDEGKVSTSGFKEIPKTCNQFADCQVKVGSDQAMRSKVSFRPATLPRKVFRDFEGNYNFKTDKNRVRREIYKAKKAKEMKSKAVAQKRGCYSDSEDETVEVVEDQFGWDKVYEKQQREQKLHSLRKRVLKLCKKKCPSCQPQWRSLLVERLNLYKLKDCEKMHIFNDIRCDSCKGKECNQAYWWNNQASQEEHQAVESVNSEPEELTAENWPKPISDLLKCI